MAGTYRRLGGSELRLLFVTVVIAHQLVNAAAIMPEPVTLVSEALTFAPTAALTAESLFAAPTAAVTAEAVPAPPAAAVAPKTAAIA
jgi:hypothetical protein